MNSKIAEALKLQYDPVALVWTDKKPEGALQFKEKKWGCVMWMLANAAQGKTVVFDRETFGCWGGVVGLGFGNTYLNFPGGFECFCHFLSSGNQGWDRGKRVAKKIGGFVRGELLDDFVHGERYIKSPELVKNFIECMPITDIPNQYVVFKPLKEVEEGKELPVVVIFLANPDQLSALVVLANYAREGSEHVIIPYAAGCQTIGIFAYREAQSERQRAIIGLTDLSARKYMRKLGADLMTFTVPFKMFQEMENNVEGSFLQRETWKALQEHENAEYPQRMLNKEGK
jgi:uncharacterized protein (DUF169 family)